MTWNGLTDLPGLSTFYCDSTSSLGSELQTFFTAITAVFPPGLSFVLPAAGDAIDENTGHITGTYSDTGFTVNVTGSAQQYPSGTGTYIEWRTADVGPHRRIRGRTFLAPILSAAFTTGGQIGTTTLSAIQSAANALVAGENLKVWHRPTPAAPSSGSAHLVTAAVVSGQVSSLRTRRR